MPAERQTSGNASLRAVTMIVTVLIAAAGPSARRPTGTPENTAASHAAPSYLAQAAVGGLSPLVIPDPDPWASAPADVSVSKPRMHRPLLSPQDSSPFHTPDEPTVPNVDSVDVPEPPVLWLLLLGASMTWWRRVRKRTG